MRLADLLVDLAAVASASRSVASKHVALRARQIERYGKTSSVVGNFKPEQKKTRQDQQQQQQQRAQAGEQPQSEPAREETPLEEQTAAAQAEAEVEIIDLQSREETTVRSEFVPAPWANGISDSSRPFAPPGSRLGALRRGPIEIPVINAENEDTGPFLSEKIDVSVFRTSKGSNILKALENAEREYKAGESQQVQLEAAPESPGAEEIVKGGARDKEMEAPKQDAYVPIENVTETGESPKTVTQDDDAIVAELARGSTHGAATLTTPAYELRESRVPSSRIGRLWNYGGLAAGMFAGAIGEGLSRAVGGGSNSGGSVMLGPANMERLVSKLSRMRGAALKLGQMMSFQDAKMLPGPIQEVLQRVQDRADYMPAWQRDRVLAANLGPEWRGLFDEFDEKPMAAASIGQVHRATLRSNGARVAVKIQFPGVADSINSDLDNISMLLAAAKLMPKGLYLNKTIDNARTELAWECDYEREAQCAARYRELLAGEDEAVFVVPKIYPEASGKHVLTMEFMEGVGVTRVSSFTQEQRDWIGTQILRLCLREIVDFKFMQTDPNWTNFLYNAERDRLELLDFGASREYPDEFISRYVRLLEAASRLDRGRVEELSEELGYLTGHESKAMLDAHITSVTTLAEPFLQSAPEVYDFSGQTITERVKAQIPVMIHERLAPPPEETYSLHRKLSGAFLLCARLGSKVRCRELFEQALAKANIPRG